MLFDLVIKVQFLVGGISEHMLYQHSLKDRIKNWPYRQANPKSSCLVLIDKPSAVRLVVWTAERLIFFSLGSIGESKDRHIVTKI